MKTILVVDDDTESRDLILSELAGAGYQIVTAGSGSEAVRIIGERHVDVVVTGELEAPFTWFELAKQLRSNSSTRYIWIVLMKSESEEPVTDEFVFTTYHVSIDHTLLKPINPKELIALLRRFFREEQR